MTIDEIFMGLSSNIINAINDNWDNAVIEIEKPAHDVISFSVSYFTNNNEIYIDFENIDTRKLTEDGNALYAITTENGSKKWNKAKFELKSSGEFNIDFKWDQYLDDEINTNK